MMEGQCGKILAVTASGAFPAKLADQLPLSSPASGLLGLIRLESLVFAGNGAKACLSSRQTLPAHYTGYVIFHNHMITQKE